MLLDHPGTLLPDLVTATFDEIVENLRTEGISKKQTARLQKLETFIATHPSAKAHVRKLQITQ